nr:putative flower spur development protein [Impatiens uliginosa]
MAELTDDSKVTSAILARSFFVLTRSIIMQETEEGEENRRSNGHKRIFKL